jgi:uncharacterized protein (TIGR02996 family)
MTEDAAFLQAIIANPDDDSLRLIYADWLEEHGQADRAAFIRVQCELVRPALDEQRWQELRARERQLLDEHEKEWAAPVQNLFPDGEASLGGLRFYFRRGFIGAISLTAEMFVRRAEAPFSLAPVEHAEFAPPWCYARDLLSELGGCP